METTTPTAKHRYIKATEVAKIMRKELKEKFPKTKFSVRKSDTSSIYVEWTDGETEKEVKEVIRKYNGEGFDGMIDMRYSYKHYQTPDGKIHFGGTNGTQGSMGAVPKVKVEVPADAVEVTLITSFVFTRREFSEGKCRQLFGNFNLNAKNPTVKEQLAHWIDYLRDFTQYDHYTEKDGVMRIKVNHFNEYEFEQIKKCLEIQGVTVSVEPQEKGYYIAIKGC